MTDMMHSTTAIVVMVVFLLVVVSALFIVVRVAGERVRADEESAHARPPEQRGD